MKQKLSRKEKNNLMESKVKIITFICSCEDEKILIQVYNLLVDNSKTSKSNEKYQVHTTFFSWPNFERIVFMTFVYDHLLRVILGCTVSFRNSAQHVNRAL